MAFHVVSLLNLKYVYLHFWATCFRFKKLFLARWGWKTVAVAKLREYESLQGAGVQEMINEVLLLSRFSHPCIVQVFGFLGKEPGFVLEYLTGAARTSSMYTCVFVR